MIKSNELRIGNWISGQNDPPMIVMSIDKHSIEADFFESEADNWYYEIEDVKGIPITPEILERIEPHNYIKCVFDNIGFKVVLGKEEIINIKYLHELQNLYFAIMGGELKIINLNVETLKG